MSTNKVIITGVNGFIGSHLAKKCLEEGYEVYGIGRDPISNDSRIKYFQIDILLDSLEDILKNTTPLFIFHCAGVADINYSVKHPDSDFETNVVMTRKLLYEISMFSPNSKVVFLSSAAVYGNPETVPIRESANTNPISPYALHKVLTENICAYFINQKEMNIKILRIFSAYGEGLTKQVLWDMCRKSKLYGYMDMFGTGEETRDFIHIDDLINAIIIVSETWEPHELIYNVANGVGISIKNIAYAIGKVLGISDNDIRFNGIEREGNPVHWCADISKIKRIGYSQSVPFENGVDRYCKWFSEFYK